jgi:hypothetical protein
LVSSIAVSVEVSSAFWSGALQLESTTLTARAPLNNNLRLIFLILVKNNYLTTKK